MSFFPFEPLLSRRTTGCTGRLSHPRPPSCSHPVPFTAARWTVSSRPPAGPETSRAGPHAGMVQGDIQYGEPGMSGEEGLRCRWSRTWAPGSGTPFRRRRPRRTEPGPGGATTARNVRPPGRGTARIRAVRAAAEPWSSSGSRLPTTAADRLGPYGTVSRDVETRARPFQSLPSVSLRWTAVRWLVDDGAFFRRAALTVRRTVFHPSVVAGLI